MVTIRRLDHEPAATSAPSAPGVAPEAAVIVPFPEIVPVVADVAPYPGAERRARRVLVILLEALDGRRPYSQVMALAMPEVIRYLRAAGHVHRPAGAAASRLLSFHASQPHEGAVEVAALVRVGRPHSLAARFDLVGADEWRCQALRLI